MPDSAPYTVAELTHYIKHLLESNDILSQAEVAGEVSNLTYHGSGHVYFSVKDRDAQLSCVLFKGNARYAPRMQAGDQVILKGRISVYAPRGSYQMVVQSVRKQGVGDLYQRFLQLKAKLEGEGLFDPAFKKPLPIFPKTIALVTSPTGAAIRDMLQTLKRRYNMGRAIIIPTTVQGQAGAPSIVDSLQKAAKTEADVILLARGGGSLEDLWNFNEEMVARAIAACPIPIISGVGHETDFTIADFVADVRASTPTAAAEAATPEKAGIEGLLDDFEGKINRQLQYFIDFKRQILDDYSYRIEQGLKQHLQKKRHQLDLLDTQLAGLNPVSRLEQGFTLTLKNGKRVMKAEELNPGDTIETVFQDGRTSSTITE